MDRYTTRLAQIPIQRNIACSQFMDDTFKIDDSKQTRGDSSARNKRECDDPKQRSSVFDRRRRKACREWVGRRHGQQRR